MERGCLSLTAVCILIFPSARLTLISMTGVAYDTEKEFDTMFVNEPYINEYESDWA